MEEPGSIGDVDMVVEFDKNTYAIFEIKYAHPEPSELERVQDVDTSSVSDGKRQRAKRKEKSKEKTKTISTGKAMNLALKKDVNVGEKLDKLALKAIEAIKEKRYGRKYRVPGNRVIEIGVGVYWRGQVKIAFGTPPVDGNFTDL
jgi:hypothetical protein